MDQEFSVTGGETIGLFIPSSIIRAVIGIYDTVVFFIQKAKDIIRMVGNFWLITGSLRTLGQPLTLENSWPTHQLVIDFRALPAPERHHEKDPRRHSENPRQSGCGAG
jgi:hypothetical protein